jgi:hypothetical protein
MWAIGNGESRSSINIDRLEGEKVGCNAILRDYRVDRLVCVDRRMVEEALRAGVNLNDTLIYTRPDWYPRYKTLKVREVPPLPYEGDQRWDEPFQWGSGPYAVLIAAMFAREKRVNLIGFDLHSSTKKVNNIYKGTDNYDPTDKRAVDPRYWIHQISMVFKYFPKIKFTVYQDPKWNMPKTWIKDNVYLDSISNIYYNT